MKTQGTHKRIAYVLIGLASVLTMQGCGSQQTIDQYEQSYDDSRRDGLIGGDNASPEDIDPVAIPQPSKDTQAEIAVVKGLDGEIEKLQNDAAKADALAKYAKLAEAVRKRSVQNAIQWKINIESDAYKLQYADFLKEGRARFVRMYAASGIKVSGADFKFYTLGSDPVMANSAGGTDKVFNELLGSDCTSFVWRIYHNAFPRLKTQTERESIYPFLSTEYLYDIAAAYIDLDNMTGGKSASLEPGQRKQLAYNYYVKRLNTKYRLINEDLKAKGYRELSPKWTTQHLTYFDYYDYIDRGKGQPGDVLVGVNSKDDPKYFEHGHAMMVYQVFANGQNPLALGAHGRSIGVGYTAFNPKVWNVLRPNLNLVMNQLGVTVESPSVASAPIVSNPTPNASSTVVASKSSPVETQSQPNESKSLMSSFVDYVRSHL